MMNCISFRLAIKKSQCKPLHLSIQKSEFILRSHQQEQNCKIFFNLITIIVNLNFRAQKKVQIKSIHSTRYINQNQRMNRLFGAAKKQQPQAPPPPKQEVKPEEPPKKTSVPLTEQQARLQNKIRELSQTVTRLDNEAKELLQKSKKSKGSAKEMYKQRCVNVLRKRKQYDTQLKNYMNQQFTLDQVAFTSQSIQNTIEMAGTMKQVVEQQKNVMKDLDIDKLDDIRDEMDELKYQSDYMNEMLNRDYNVDIDEDDLDDELGELERQLKAQKNVQKKKEVNVPQQLNNL